MEKEYGYHGRILEIDLTSGKARPKQISSSDFENYVGGRGLGMKLLWDRLTSPGIDPLSSENPLMFMPGPFSGFPPPASSRTCVVTKSPHTSPLNSPYAHASTVSYSNMGGFFGPEIRFAGHDGLLITGKAKSPVYILIEDDKVEIRDARKFWGMGTDDFDRALTKELDDRRFQSCYIGPAGENLVKYASILNTTARAAGRGGTGCVMGSKNLKAIAIKGSCQPGVAHHERFLALVDEARQELSKSQLTNAFRESGTAMALVFSSNGGTMAVKNYREGTFAEVEKIGAGAAKKTVWKRNFACFTCPIACKKSGRTTGGPYAGLVHDGPEYETGTMLGANLMISDLKGILKCIYLADDMGIDAISLGNVIGFLMEAYDRGDIDRGFLDGIDLKWGDVDATLEMVQKIGKRQGIGDLASQGVKALSAEIGKDSARYAIHVKGHELAAWNIQADPFRAVCYVTANRGACHLNGGRISEQDNAAAVDCTGVCNFAAGAYGKTLIPDLLSAITGGTWSETAYHQAGERAFNLEKMFNYREGFRREDDRLPNRFFEDPLTMGPKKGAVLERKSFEASMDQYYQERGWDPKTSRPKNDKLKALGLSFTAGV